jgi:hypothetical protein
VISQITTNLSQKHTQFPTKQDITQERNKNPKEEKQPEQKTAI